MKHFNFIWAVAISVVLLSSCSLDSQQDASNYEINDSSSEVNLEDSNETTGMESEDVKLKYFPIALDGTGIDLPRIDLSQFGITDKADQNEIFESMNYRVNYIFYGIGLFSEWFDPEEYLITVSEVSVGASVEYPVSDGVDTAVEIPIMYELTSVASDVPDWFLDVTLVLRDKESPYIFDDWNNIYTSVRTVYDEGGRYFTKMCPFEICVESEVFGNDYYDASLEGWAKDIYGINEYDAGGGVDGIDSPVNILSDSELQYDALTYLNQVASKIESEKFNEGYITFMAAPNTFTTITHRTDDTITLQGEINYWFNGGNPDGKIIATIIMDRCTGNVISCNLN